MSQFLSLMLTGAVSGAIYSLLATGLTLTYSASGIFNFGHGAIAFTTAFVYYQLNSGLGWSIVPAALVAIFVFAPLMGVLLDLLIFRPLASSTEIARIIAPVGLLVALPAAAMWLVEILVDIGVDLPKGDTVFLPPGIGPAPARRFRLAGGISIDSNQVIVLSVSALAAAALWFLLRRTRFGLNLRSTVDRRRLAELRGINTDRASSSAWAIGTLLAGLAGVVGAPVLNSLSPATYTLVMMVAATAAVAGRLRSIPIAFVAGMALGVIQNLVAGYAKFAQHIPGFAASVPPMLLVVFLVFLGRDRSRAAGTAAEIRRAPTHQEAMADLSPFRRRLPWGIFISLLLVYLFFLANSYWVSLVAQGLTLAIVFMSFKIVTGIGGMVSLAQATFVTFSGLVAGVLFDRGWPFLPALVVATLASVALGMIVALPSMRLGGVFLALATLSLGLVSERILFTWTKLSNELNAGWTVPRPSFGPIDLNDMRTFAVCILALLGVVVALVRNLERSSSGRAMSAVSASEAAATASGVSVVRTKLTLFAVSSAIAGLGGVLLASYRGGSNATAFPTTTGLVWLAAMVLFGINRSGAALVAGLVTACSPAIFTDGVHWPSFIPSFLDWDGTDSVWISQLLFGLGAIQMARFPDGALALTAHQNHQRRMKWQARKLPPPRQARDEATSAATVPVSDVFAPALPPDAALTIQGLHASYGEVSVLHGITLGLGRNRSLALLGPNGAGKSTLVGVLAGHLPATSGTVRLFGEDITNVSAHRRPQLGLLVAPESRGIFPGLTVEENLSVWLPDPADRLKAFERFPALHSRRSIQAANLSGGEQQMLAMAPVVMRPPQVLIADEPTLGLAPLVADRVMEILRELAESGVSTLIIEEKAERVLSIADEVAVIERGVIVSSTPRAQVDSGELAAAYLGGA